MTNLYSFIGGSLEWPFSELFLSDVWNQYKFMAFNIFSCNILIIYCKLKNHYSNIEMKQKMN